MILGLVPRHFYFFVFLDETLKCWHECLLEPKCCLFCIYPEADDENGASEPEDEPRSLSAVLKVAKRSSSAARSAHSLRVPRPLASKFVARLTVGENFPAGRDTGSH